MGPGTIEDDLARRFRIDRPPTLLAQIFKSTYSDFARMRDAVVSEWPFNSHATGRGLCILGSAIDAVFLELMDGRTAQRSTRPASRRCTAG